MEEVKGSVGVKVVRGLEACQAKKPGTTSQNPQRGDRGHLEVMSRQAVI